MHMGPRIRDNTNGCFMWLCIVDTPPLPDLRRQLSDEMYQKLLAENTADSKEDNIDQVNEIMAVQT